MVSVLVLIGWNSQNFYLLLQIKLIMFLNNCKLFNFIFISTLFINLYLRKLMIIENNYIYSYLF